MVGIAVSCFAGFGLSSGFNTELRKTALNPKYELKLMWLKHAGREISFKKMWKTLLHSLCKFLSVLLHGIFFHQGILRLPSKNGLHPEWCLQDSCSLAITWLCLQPVCTQINEHRLQG